MPASRMAWSSVSASRSAAVHRAAAGKGPRLDGADDAGHGGVDRHAQAFPVTDLLAQQHPLPYSYQGFAGRADVLAQRHGHLMGRHLRDGAAGGEVLMAGRVDTAEKVTLHPPHLSPSPPARESSC